MKAVAKLEFQMIGGICKQDSHNKKTCSKRKLFNIVSIAF